MPGFQLHPTLAQETLPVGRMRLCEVRLMDDRRFPWLILVPRLPELTELHQLPTEEQCRLIAESSAMASVLLRLYEADKINVAALGNVVPQLHWHVVARRRQDVAWPSPVWGFGTRVPYGRADAESTVARLRTALPLFAD